MRLNWQKFGLMVLGLLLIWVFLMYFSFRFTGSANEIIVIKNDHLVAPGATVEFTFVPKVDHILGLVLNFDKYYYIDGEKKGTLNITLEYRDKDGSFVTRNQTIAIKTISKGDKEVLFAPLEKSLGQPVTVKVVADENTLIKADPGLTINLVDSNPDTFIDTAPRPVYRFSAKDVANKIYGRFLDDRKFAILYGSLLSINLIVIFVLMVVDDESKRKNH